MRSLSAHHARLAAVRTVALELMTRHGLHDWTFAFNHAKRAMGMCRYGTRTIELSVHLVGRNGAQEVIDTILHEIAHALVGPSHNHDDVWKRKCLEIGATPARCGQADMPPGQWQARCGMCGILYSRHRRPKQRHGWFCKSCGPEHGQLTWQAHVSAGD